VHAGSEPIAECCKTPVLKSARLLSSQSPSQVSCTAELRKEPGLGIAPSNRCQHLTSKHPLSSLYFRYLHASEFNPSTWGCCLPVHALSSADRAQSSAHVQPFDHIQSSMFRSHSIFFQSCLFIHPSSTLLNPLISVNLLSVLPCTCHQLISCHS
jgi:hypothetical protein